MRPTPFLAFVTTFPGKTTTLLTINVLRAFEPRQSIAPRQPPNFVDLFSSKDDQKDVPRLSPIMSQIAATYDLTCSETNCSRLQLNYRRQSVPLNYT